MVTKSWKEEVKELTKLLHKYGMTDLEFATRDKDVKSVAEIIYKLESDWYDGDISGIEHAINQLVRYIKKVRGIQKGAT
jgi:hypothetical protein